MVKIKLGDVIDFKNGKSVKKSDGIIPIYGGNGILGYTDKSNFSHTIVVGRVGAYCGSIHVEDNSCWVSDNAIAGVPKEGQDLTYLYYVLKSLNLNSKQIGSSQPLITQSMLKDMVVDIEIDIEKQKKIANSISIIDQKIQINNQINQELEAMAKTLYEYWFVQFDFPDQYGKPYKSSGGKMIYHPELKREIPEGWGVTKLNEVVDLISGYPFSSNDYVTSGKYKLYTIKNVQDGYTVDKVDNYLDFLPSNMSHECQLRRGDLIMSLTGNVGRVGMVYEDDVLLNQRVLKLNPINKTHKSFIYSFFRSDVTKAHLENMSTGTSQKNLSPIDIGNMMIPFPSESLLSKFLDNLNMLENNLVENQQLTKLRDWLLPMLMNGQVYKRIEGKND